MELSTGAGKRFLLLVSLSGLLVLAGCAGLGGEDGPDRPEAFEPATEGLDEETTETLWEMVSEDGELTGDGETLLDRLAELDESKREAVVSSLAGRDIDDETVGTLEDVLASTPSTQREILRGGLADRSGDGLLDGEAELLGLDPARTYPEVATAARTLADGGYNDVDVEYLRRLGSLSDDEFAKRQVVALDLVPAATENGTVTRADLRRLGDQSDDGLIDAMAAQLGLDPAQKHPRIVSLARPLSAEGYTNTELSYLESAVAVSTNRTTLEQAEYLGLLNETVEDGLVDDATVEALQERRPGLIDGFARRLGLDNRTDNGTVAALAGTLAADGYAESDVAYLERAAAVTAVPFQYEQARSLSLLSEPTANGTATRADRGRLEDTAGDGLLDATARELGVDPAAEHPTLVEYAEPLAEGGYTGTEYAYLRRVDEIAEYRGHEYELWAQAEQLGLLGAAVENGTVTERQLWGLGNNASNRLLNAMEVEFGTDPDVADTSGDGYPDHLAWGPLRDLGLDVTPGEPDVYVEVDTVSGQSPPDEGQRETIQSAFDSGSTGPVNVHFRECTDGHDPISRTGQLRDRIGDYRSSPGLGFHYLLINDRSIDVNGLEAAGVTFVSTSESSWMTVDGTIETRASASYESGTITHELGHSLGIFDDNFAGVDSREYSSQEYSSVMNYNHRLPVTFSDGEPFDDYAHMRSQSFGSFHQNRSALEEMWETGEVDDAALCG